MVVVPVEATPAMAADPAINFVRSFIFLLESAGLLQEK
jgi:hypothetical protein